MKRNLFSLLVLILCFDLYAQDYIVLTKGDTVKGTFKILSYDLMDRVQITANKKEIYTALQVRILHQKEDNYKAVRYDNSIRFMKILKPGFLSLLAFKPTGTGSWDGRYLSKIDGSGMEVPNLSFKKSLSKYLSDCPVIEEKLDKGELGKRDLEKIIDLYNACLLTKSDQKISSRKDPVPASENIESLEKVTAVKKLIEKVDAGDFLSKEDASDLLKDVLKKVEKGEKVPNYLTEGLKSYLDKTPLKGDLDSLLELLKK